MGAEINISHLFAGKFSNINKPVGFIQLLGWSLWSSNFFVNVFVLYFCFMKREKLI